MEQQAFPTGWIEQLHPLLGNALPDFLHSYEEPPVRGIRMRPGIAPPPEALDPVPWAGDAYYLPLDSRAGARPAHEAGAYYLQEPSAMVSAALLCPQPGERVLDLCAAPGGKSTQLAAYMAGRGVLVCNEPVPARAKILSRNLERMGVPNALAVCALPEELSQRWEGYFDKILVDAPCSGEGMFRRHPETRLEWNAAAPAGCAQRQSAILRHAARMLRPGGRLVYSTCTFNPTENEGVIEGFLRAHPDFSLIPSALPGIPDLGGPVRVWPHQAKGEGHFAALMQKDGGAAVPARKNAPSASFSPLGKAEAALADAFLREHIDDKVRPSALFAGKITALPEEMPLLDGVKLLRAGLTVGEIKGKVFVPDHALALACRPLRAVAVSEDQARAYQAGEVLSGDETLRGFYALTLDGLPLGWCKAGGGQMKNHYPKGLRRQPGGAQASC